MAQLPIVSGSEVQTPMAGVQRDVGPLREAVLAKGKLAGAIANDFGPLFEDVSQKIQANRNARTVFNADLAMRKTKDDFTDQLAKMPDERAWLPAWQKNVDALREQHMAQTKGNPATKRQLSMMFDGWARATTSEIKAQALRKGLKDTREDAIADATYAAHQGDLKGAQTIMQSAVEHYALSPSDANKLSKRFPSIAAQAQADTVISSNPIKAPELIEQLKDKIDPRVFLGIKARAAAAKNRAQADNVNSLAEQMDNSADGTIDPKMISSKVEAGEITQKAADGLIKRMERKKISESKNDFHIGMMEAFDHKWTEDKNPDETARGLKDDYVHLPPALRIRLYREIDSQMNAAKKEGEKDEKPLERQIFSSMAEDRKKGVFAPSADMDSLGEPMDISDKKVQGDERLRYAQATAKMRDWFKANPKATEQEAEDYRQSLTLPHLLGHTINAIKPQSDISEQDYQKLKKGEAFWFKGKKFTKQ